MYSPISSRPMKTGNFPVGDPDPIDAIEFFMEPAGLESG